MALGSVQPRNMVQGQEMPLMALGSCSCDPGEGRRQEKVVRSVLSGLSTLLGSLGCFVLAPVLAVLSSVCVTALSAPPHAAVGQFMLEELLHLSQLGPHVAGVGSKFQALIFSFLLSTRTWALSSFHTWWVVPAPLPLDVMRKSLQKNDKTVPLAGMCHSHQAHL